MEPDTKYALHHATDPSTLKWAATIKLTPEVLQKLQAGSVSIRFAAEKTETSVLRVDGESFELLSFQEDRSVSHLCTLKREQPSSSAGGGEGYAFHETGRIAKKLLVQRMLDGTEKDRLKDRHAQCVVDSKARSSILLDDKPATGSKTKARLKRQVIYLDPSSLKSTSSAPSTSARKRRLPSALTPEALQNMTLAIDKDELRHLPPPASSATPHPAAASTDAVEETVVKKKARKSAAVRGAPSSTRKATAAKKPKASIPPISTTTQADSVAKCTSQPDPQEENHLEAKQPPSPG
ncbi:hypothetical protein DYB28_009612 [Aphanomyces astaci]|uniref:Uncharacterized protein n=1 Tax=Aphanomyces astaci TaxID=112090 RepID=A0A397ANW1_APHAT|nr:hypothetical protein DYB36_002279 [Aphanomyces astaci]RLO12010.1 hypothetical protein DYB28_009612 [Aphanomyces astaci]